MTDTADLRRRVYDAARTPAIRLSESTLKLARAGGVFHLNSTEADEIAAAVLAVIEPILAERDRLQVDLYAALEGRPRQSVVDAAWRELVPDDVRRDLTASDGQTETSATRSDEIG